MVGYRTVLLHFNTINIDDFCILLGLLNHVNQCCGLVTFWCGLDPDPDPAIFIIDLQDASIKQI